MYRQDDLHRFIAVIGAALAGPIMADLRSEPVRGVARGLLEMLDRLSSDLVDGDPMAQAALPTVRQLEEGFLLEDLRRPAAAQPTLRDELDQRLLSLQEAVGTGQGFDRLVDAIRRNDADAAQWMDNASALLIRLNDELEASFARQAERPSIALGGRDPKELEERFSAYLTGAYPELPPEPLAAFSLVPGGNSKMTVLFSLKPNAVLPEHLALRVDIANSITGAQLKDEYPILQRVHALGLPVPQPILFEPDPSWLGGAFVVTTQVTNALFGGSPFPEDRRRDGCSAGPDFGVEVAQLVARLHGGTLEPAARPDLEAQRDAQVARLYEEWRSLEKPPLSISLDLGVAWMHGKPLPAGRPACLIHGDVGHHNILTRDGHVAVLLDWELSKIGDPSEDLAQIKMMLIDGVIAWDAFVEAYIAAGGPPAACDPHAVAWYTNLTYLKHGVNQTRLRNRFLRGERSDLSAALIASHYQDRITLYQARALADAMALPK